MFLDCAALVILLIGLALVFYTFVYIHDLPYAIAKQRHHPHEEAIHVACWLSLFTLHAIWPIVFLWAVAHKKSEGNVSTVAAARPEAGLNAQLAQLEARVRKLESAK